MTKLPKVMLDALNNAGITDVEVELRNGKTWGGMVEETDNRDGVLVLSAADYRYYILMNEIVAIRIGP